MVMGPPAAPAEGAAITATFGSGPVAPPIGMGTVPIAAGGMAPIAYNGSSIGYLTGPVVGPGVAAFGATSVPAYPINPLASFNAGAAYAGTGINAGGGLAGSRGPVPRMVTETFQNTEVLAALVKLTGQDFGYNVSTWRRWLRTSFQPDPAPARSVPQP
jgi:hypothetical protein